MVKARSVPARLAALLAVPATLAVTVSVTVAVTPAVAQYNNPYSTNADSGPTVPPPAASRARRNDAYQPAETGPGLGTLSGPGAGPGAGYGSAPPPAPYSPAPYGGGPIAQASPNDGYTPRYSEPVRPYGTPDSAPHGQQGSGDPGPAAQGYGRENETYRAPAGAGAPYAQQPGGYGEPYGQPVGEPGRYDDRAGYRGEGYRGDDRRYDDRGPDPREARDGTFTHDDVVTAGGRFFGSASQGLASVVENLFKRQGRPNGYILGEEGGGAFVAGLRYGEGTLYTRDAGTRKVYWQGPSVGYDVGGAGSKVMILVYNLHSVNEIYERFGGVDGSAYFIGGVGVTLLKRDHVTLAPIRTGVGLRLGANVGYLKFTPQATWNPF